MDPLAAEARQAVDRIDLRGRRADRVADRLREFRGDDFVGIEDRIQSVSSASSARFFCGPKPGQSRSTITRAPCACAIATVSSVLPPSMTTTSSANDSAVRLREPRGRVEGDEGDAEGGFSHEIVGKGGENGERQYTRGPGAARIGWTVPAGAVRL